MPTTTAIEVRPVTDDEVEFFRVNGWVHLPELVSRDAAASILDWFESRENDESSQPGPNANHKQGSLAYHYEPSSQDDFMASVAHAPGFGQAACRLMREPAVRYTWDTGLVKPPASGGGEPTLWHQDWPEWPIDRRGSLGFWLALNDITEEMGSLQFLNESRKVGPLGMRPRNNPDLQLTDEYPWLLDEFEVSPKLHLNPGDATVHDGLTVHSAGPNRSDNMRWAYAWGYIPAHARYTGKPSRHTEGLGLEIGEEWDNPKFPLFTSS